MQIIIQIFDLVFLGPVVNILVALIKGLELIHIPGALGFAIIILTILIRLIVWPLMSTQLKSAKKMSDLKPHLDELKKKHGSDKQALSKAQMDLYKQHGINPAAGCLPSIIQIPIIIGLYQAILAIFDPVHGLERINNLLYFPWLHLDKAPDASFFGLDLTIKPSQFNQVGYLVLLIPIITAVFTFAQSKMMTPLPVKPYPSDSPKEKKEKESTEDAMGAVQGQMAYMMPLMIGYFAFQFPIGLAFYWNTFTLLGIVQQYLLTGWGGLAPLLNRFIRTDVKSPTKVTIRKN